jgi:hypothetical protein
MTFNETIVYNKKCKQPLGPYVSIRKNRKIETVEKTEAKRKSSLIINVFVLIAIVAMVGMSVVSIPEPQFIPISKEVVVKKVVAAEPGFMVSLGYYDNMTEVLEHLYNDHKVLINFVGSSQELMLGPFSTVDEVIDYLQNHQLAEHLDYVQMKNGKKVYYEKKSL